MHRWFELAKSVVVGYFVGGLLGIATATLIGTASLALGANVHLGFGPIPFMEAHSNAAGDGFSTEWGIWVFAIAGAVVAGFQALRRPVSAA